MKTILIALYLCVCVSHLTSGGVRINGMGTTYTTIQAAVTNASPGDFIAISTGVYEESVNIYNTDLTLIGGYDLTYTNVIGESVVDGVWSGLISPGSILDITNSLVTLRNLEITDGGFSVFTPAGYGGGIDVRGGSHVLVQSCLIHDNSCKGYGGGIYVKDAHIELVNSPVYDNIAYKSSGFPSFSAGGGIAVTDNGQVHLSGSSTDIDGNWAVEGGGVLVNGATLIAANNSDIQNNIAVTKGGGVLLVNNATGIVEDTTTLIGLSATLGNSVTNGSGGGVYAEDSYFLLRNQAGLWHNYASENGGGVYLTNSTMVMDDAHIGYHNYDNRTNYAGFYGGGICMFDSTLEMMNNAYICRCYAALGAGICAFNSQINAHSGACIGYPNGIAGNTAETVAGGISSFHSSLIFNNASIKDNFARNGGGGVYAIGTGNYHFTQCEIAYNTSSGTVGGVFAQPMGGDFILDATDIISNQSITVGGLFYISPAVPLIMHNGSRLSHNSSLFVGAMQLAGTGYVENSEISMNSSAGDVGGIYLSGSTTYLECKDTDLVGNYAGATSNMTNGQAGAFAVMDSKMTIIAENKTVDVMGNRARDGGALYTIDSGDIDFIATPPYAINIQDNTALEKGAGVWCNNATIFMSGNVRLDGNTAKFGAGIYATNAAVVTMTADQGYMPEIVNNHAWESGAGMYALASNTVITLSNTFIGLPGQGNIADAQSALFNGGGAAWLAYYARLNAVNCQFIDNFSGNVAGAVFAAIGSHFNTDSDFATAPILPPNTFVNNSAVVAGGACIAYWLSRLDINDALIMSNHAPSTASIAVTMGSTANVVNAVCTHNSSEQYSAVLSSTSSSGALLQNCTIVGNTSNAVMSAGSAPVTMQNCIVWDNIGATVISNCNTSFCDIQGGYPGSFNKNENPLFVDPAGMNYQLTEASPCINAGATLVAVTNDCIGNPRPYEGAWDMGAYEFVPEPAMTLVCFVFGIVVCRMRKK